MNTLKRPLKGAKALVLGFGKSGQSATSFLIQNGSIVTVVDRLAGTLSQTTEGKNAQNRGVCFSSEEENIDLSTFDFVVASPGISANHTRLQKAKELGVEVIGEIELALPYIQSPIIGITGTNGKTTTTLLVSHILNTAGIKAQALGNIGVPLAQEVAMLDPKTVVVLELSSFQLDTMKSDLLTSAAVLNITPDHLDRYENLDAYAKSKWQIARFLKPEGTFWSEDRAWKEFGHLSNSQPLCYGYEASNDLYFADGHLKSGNKTIISLPTYQSSKSHDVENIMAAYVLCQPFGVTTARFLQALDSFQKPRHRIEWVCEKNGIRFFDDSKGTNIDAVIRAVESIPGEIVLIAGGVDKGAPYTPWIQAFGDKIQCVVAIGESASRIQKDLQGKINVHCCKSLESAVRYAFHSAKPGQSVLLSPGCSSYDMFRDYAHRGEEFQRIVKSLVDHLRSE